MILDIVLVILSSLVTALVREVFVWYRDRVKYRGDNDDGTPDHVAVALGDDGLIRLSFGDTDADDEEHVTFSHRWIDDDQALFIASEINAALDRTLARTNPKVKKG